MATLRQELRYVLRRLLKAPGFTAVVALTLALGIGANTAIYSLFDAVVLRPLPVREPDRLYEVQMAWSYPDYQDFRSRSDVFSELAAFATRDEMRTGQGERAEVMAGSLVSTNYFAALGVAAAAGRTFGPDDARQPVAVLGYDLWQRLFGGRKDALGKTIVVNGQTLTVIGVAPRRFRGTSLSSNPQFWMPLEMGPQVLGEPMGSSLLEARDFTWLRLIGRTRPGVSPGQARAALNNLNHQLQEEYPEMYRESDITLKSVTSTALGLDNEKTLMRFIWTLALMVGFVLLVASANVASLLLARAMRSRKELALRLALGAVRRHLIRQLLLESLVLAALGGLAGIGVALAILRLLGSFQLPGRIVIGTLGLGLDWQLLGFTFLLSALVGVLFGLAPALQASRPNLTEALNDQVPAQSHSKARLRNAFVIVQIAFSLVLLVGGGLFVKSLRNALTTDVGFDPDRVAFATVNLGLLDYDASRAEGFYRQALDRLAALPGVEAVSWANLVPFRRARTEILSVDGYTPAKGEDTTVMTNYVTPDYFRTLGLTVLRGRSLNARDEAGAPPAGLINQTLAERYWPGRNPVGRRVSTDDGATWIEIAGVVEDSKYRSLDEKPTPYLYLSLFQFMDTTGTDEMNLLVRGRDPVRLVPVLRRELGQLDASLPVLRARTLREHMGEVLLPQRMGAALLGGFSLLALTLAAVGIYGLLSYLVATRTHEIGVRMALGAPRGTILGLVLRRSLVPVGLGVAAGLVVAFWTTRLIAGFLFGVSGFDPAVFLLTVLLLVAVSLIACYLPALRASRVNPTIALRQY